MPAKESVSLLETQQIGGRASHRHEAIGAEIPVTVHASRTTQAVGNVLPPVHEDTKTVIVLPQGAVVRLTAGLITGETVVLTNRMTGTDVLCRVGNVKTQPGIQHYVSLEFTQRAPGFWGHAVPAAAGPILSPEAAPAAPSPTSPLQSAPPLSAAISPTPVTAKPPALLTPSEPQRPPISATAPPVLSPVQQAPVAAPAPLAQTPLTPVPATVRQATHADSISPTRSGVTQSSFSAVGMESTASNSSGGSKVLLAIAAALLLILSGAAGGYWFYGQQRAVTAAPAASQPAATLAAQPVVESASGENPLAAPQLAESEAPLVATAADAGTTLSDLGASEVSESHREADSGPSRVAPQPVVSARTTKPALRHSVPIGRMQAPKAKITSARMDANTPPPVISGTLNVSETNSLLAAETVGPPPPAVSSRPSVGTRVEPPQAISSPAPAYPSSARALAVHGVVVLDVLVDETGKVAGTQVISGPPPLLSAAQQAVITWKYKPALLNGKPFAVHTKVSVVFNLN